MHSLLNKKTLLLVGLCTINNFYGSEIALSQPKKQLLTKPESLNTVINLELKDSEQGQITSNLQQTPPPTPSVITKPESKDNSHKETLEDRAKAITYKRMIISLDQLKKLPLEIEHTNQNLIKDSKLYQDLLEKHHNLSKLYQELSKKHLNLIDLTKKNREAVHRKLKDITPFLEDAEKALQENQRLKLSYRAQQKLKKGTIQKFTKKAQKNALSLKNLKSQNLLLTEQLAAQRFYSILAGFSLFLSGATLHWLYNGGISFLVHLLAQA